MLAPLERIVWSDRHGLPAYQFVRPEVRNGTIVSGLLPVCAWCKKIRNDAGTWEPWEVYSRSHSGLEITHGMCQECADQFNPETKEKT